MTIVTRSLVNVMLFRLWFHIFRIALAAFLSVFIAAVLIGPPVVDVLANIAIGIVLGVGIAGAIVGGAMTFWGIRSACPFCGTCGEWIFYTKREVAMLCDECGIVHGNPMLHFRLSVEPWEEESDPEEVDEPQEASQESTSLPIGPFFERTDTFRHWQYWLILAFVAAMGGVGIWFCIEAAKEFGWGVFAEPLALLFCGVFTGVSVPLTIYMALRLLVDPLRHTRIDEQGITINGKTLSWDEIQTVYERANKSDANYLCFRLRRWRFERMTHIYPWLSDAESERILGKIESFVAEKYPHVEV